LLKHNEKKAPKQPVKIPDFDTRYFYGGTIGNKGKQRENKINEENRKWNDKNSFR